MTDRYFEWTARLAAYQADTARMAVLAAGAVILLVLASRINRRAGALLFWGGYAFYFGLLVFSLLEMVAGASLHR
ncbi:MAG: hypothetical protein IT317_13630 [Anaerolineales bacterium]|nr:hypothetical protein [Anaerolineales bacterium]